MKNEFLRRNVFNAVFLFVLFLIIVTFAFVFSEFAHGTEVNTNAGAEVGAEHAAVAAAVVADSFARNATHRVRRKHQCRIGR